MSNTGQKIYNETKKGDVNALRKLFMASPGFADSFRDRQLGETALFVAVKAGDAETTKMLLAAGANADRKRNDGETPLMQAAAGGSVRVTKLLLGAGADVSLASATGTTALMKAAADTSSNALVSNKRKKSVLELLLEGGADPNAQDEAGRAALGYAAAAGADAAILKLLNAGAQPNLPDAAGFTALHIVVGGRATEALLAGGANADLQAADGSTAMHSAAQTGHMETLARVVAYCADVTLLNKEGDSARMVAKKAENSAAVALLEARMRAILVPLISKSLNSRTSKGASRLERALRTCGELGHVVDANLAPPEAAAALLAELRGRAVSATPSAASSPAPSEAGGDSEEPPKPDVWTPAEETKEALAEDPEDAGDAGEANAEAEEEDEEEENEGEEGDVVGELPPVRKARTKSEEPMDAEEMDALTEDLLPHDYLASSASFMNDHVRENMCWNGETTDFLEASVKAWARDTGSHYVEVVEEGGFSWPDLGFAADTKVQLPEDVSGEPSAAAILNGLGPAGVLLTEAVPQPSRDLAQQILRRLWLVDPIQWLEPRDSLNFLA